MRGRYCYQIVHTELTFFVDLDKKSVTGQAELLFIPKLIQPSGLTNGRLIASAFSGNEYRNIPLNFGKCREYEIKGVFVNGTPTTYEWKQNYCNRPVANLETVRDLKNYDTLFNEELDLSDEGELCVRVPDQVPIGTPLQKGHSGPQVKELEHVHEALRVCVVYEINKPQNGLHFATTSPGQMFAYNTSWFPCIDSLTERTSFCLNLTVDSNAVVVSSGDLKSRRIMNREGTLTTWVFETEQILAKHLGLAIGYFETLPAKDAEKQLTSFCPPGQKEKLEYSVPCVLRAINIYEEYLQHPYPFNSYKQVFVDEAFTDALSFAGMSMFSSSLLHNYQIIDQGFQTRALLGRSLALSWVQECITILTHADTWFISGITGFLHSLFVKREFGHAECEYQKTLYRIHPHPEEHPHPNKNIPLKWEGYGHPTELDMKFIGQKSLLVFQMLEYQMNPDNFKEFIVGFMRPQSGDKKGKNKWNKKKIIEKQIIRVLGKDGPGEEFFKRWIKTPSCPEFMIQMRFDTRAKKTLLEFSNGKRRGKWSQKLTGTVRIRVHEDRMFEHSCPLSTKEPETHELHFRGKPPRKSKKRGRDDSEKNQSPVNWIRIDPEYEWIISTAVFQKPALSLEQLSKDKDVKAQMEALDAMFHKTETAISLKQCANALVDAVSNPQYYWKVRVFAAQILADTKQMADSLQYCFEVIHKHFKSVVFDEMDMLKPNNFQDFSEYFVQKEIPYILSTIRNDVDLSHDDVVSLLIKLLDDNDNSKNDFSDDFYVANIIRGLGNIRLPQGTPELVEIKKVIKRYLDADAIHKSFRNVVTQACLKAYSNLERAEQLRVPLDYMDFVSNKCFEDVRVAAFESMVNMIPQSPSKYIPMVLHVVENCEKVPGVRLKMFQAWERTFKLMDHQLSYRHQHVTTSKPLQRLVEFDKLRRDVPESYLLMEKLWVFLTKSPIYEIRHSAYRIYKLIWGKDVPPCAVDGQQKLAGKIEAQPRVGNFRRRAKAHEELNSLQAEYERQREVAMTYGPSTRSGGTRRSSRRRAMDTS